MRWLCLSLLMLTVGCQKNVSTRATLTIAYLKGRLCGRQVISSLNTFDVNTEETPCNATFAFLLSNGQNTSLSFSNPVETASPDTRTLPRNTLVSQRTITLQERGGADGAAVYVENPRRPTPEVNDLSEIRWDNPYYIIFRLKSLSQTGSMIDFPYGVSAMAEDYFFGRQRNNTRYCDGKGRRNGPFSVRIYNDTPATQQPPSPVNPWGRDALLARPGLMCSHTHKSAFAVRLTDAEIAHDRRTPFAVEVRVQGQPSQFFRVNPNLHENFTVLTVLTDDPR